VAVLEVHQPQVGLDRDRRAPDRTREPGDERRQEPIVAEQGIDRGQLTRESLRLGRHDGVEQLDLTVSQSKHSETPAGT
jgi:hypothetical protein